MVRSALVPLTMAVSLIACGDGEEALTGPRPARPLIIEAVSNDRVLSRSEQDCGPFVRGIRVDGITVLEAIETAPRLYRRVKIRGRQCKTCRKQASGRRRAIAQAKSVGGVCLLRRDDAAAQPLVGVLGT